MACKPSTAWPVEREEKLKRLWETSLSATGIAGELGVSRGAVLGKAHRMNLTLRVGGLDGRYGEGNARNLGLEPRQHGSRPALYKIKASTRPAYDPRKIDLAPCARIHLGMQVLKPNAGDRMAKDMTKNQLRAFLNQAVVNTAASPISRILITGRRSASR
jgi:hypothetical protein